MANASTMMAASSRTLRDRTFLLRATILKSKSYSVKLSRHYAYSYVIRLSDAFICSTKRFFFFFSCDAKQRRGCSVSASLRKYYSTCWNLIKLAFNPLSSANARDSIKNSFQLITSRNRADDRVSRTCDLFKLERHPGDRRLYFYVKKKIIHSPCKMRWISRNAAITADGYFHERILRSYDMHLADYAVTHGLLYLDYKWNRQISF